MKIYILLLFLFIISCSTNGDEQSRAYVEGKVLTNSGLDKVQLKLVGNNIIMSETSPKSDGTFKLSGPIPSQNFSLTSNFKITAFNGRSKLKLSADSLSIEFPAGVNYESSLVLKLEK